MQPSLARNLDRMVQSIVKRFAPQRIILFGSHASGTADADSDLDLLVVMTPRGSKAAQELDILKTLRRYRMPKDVIVTTPEDFAWRKEFPAPSNVPPSSVAACCMKSLDATIAVVRERVAKA